MTERSVNVKLKMDVAAYLAGARAASAATRDVDKAARDLRKALNDEEDAAGRVRVAEERLNEARKSGKASASQLAAAEEDLARAHRQHEVATDRVSAANERYIESQKKAAAESKNTADKVDTDMSRMAKRTNAQFDALKFTGFSVGLPAAAAAGVLATTGILAGAGALFIGLGVVGARGADQVREAWIGTTNVITHGVTEMSRVYESHLVNSSEMVSTAFMRSSGLIEKGMVNAAGGVETLTGGALNLAENALPGVVSASGRLGPVLDGTASLLGDVGAGFGDMAANASQGSEAAGQSITILGGTVRMLESRMGTLFANLANGSAGPLRSLDAIVDQLTGSLVDVTAQGSGVIGLFQGFSTTGTGAITVLHGILAAASALPPELTQLVGSFGAVQMIASKLGIDAGAGFDGLGEKIKKAEGAGGKFKATIGGLAAGALNPAFLGVSALTIGLDLLGEAQERAAQKAADHAENVRGLLQAYREDGGVVGQATKTYNANALASKNAEANLGSFGVTIGLAKNAILGNAGAYSQLQRAGDSRIEQIGRESGLTATQVKNLQDVSHNLLANGGSYSDVASKVDILTQGQVSQGRSASAAASKLTDANRTMFEQLSNANGAVGDQIRAQRDAQNAYYASESALTGLSEAQVRARDSTVEHTQAIYEQINASLGYRGAVLNVQQALENYNKVLKDGKSTALERQQAELQLEQAMQAQIAAAGKEAAAAAQGATDKQKEAIATAAMNTETVRLAGTFSGPLPASLAQTIGKMDATSAVAAGLKLGVNKLGEAVYFLPNGKYIRIESNADQQAARMQALRDRINEIPTNKKSTVEIVTIYRQVGTAAVRTGNNAPDVYLYGPHAAAGGMVSKAPTRKFAGGGMVDIRPGGLLRGPGSGTSDSILGMSSRGPAAFSDEEFVVNAKDTKRALPILQFINNGGLRGYANGGIVQAEDGTWVPESFYSGAPKGPHAMYSESGFAKLRAAALANGIWSLSDQDQDQLRTYGGWQNTLVQRAITSGTAVQSVGRGFGGGSVQFNFSFPNYVGSRDELVSAIRSKVSDLGGDVQKALGRRG